MQVDKRVATESPYIYAEGIDVSANVGAALRGRPMLNNSSSTSSCLKSQKSQVDVVSTTCGGSTFEV